MQVQVTATPVTKVTSELSSIEDTVDSTRDDAEAQVPVATSAPKEPGAVERTRHDFTHMQYRSWCFSCVAGRGADDPHRKASGCTGPPRVECDFMFFTSRVHLVKSWTEYIQHGRPREPGDGGRSLR